MGVMFLLGSGVSIDASMPSVEIAAISMFGSSVLVAVNALALKRLRLPRRGA